MASVAVSMKDSSNSDYLVACPACETKFAMEEEVVLSFNKPRLHCSRCDHLFEPNWDALTTIYQAEHIHTEATQHLSLIKNTKVERRKIKPTQEFNIFDSLPNLNPPHEHLEAQEIKDLRGQLTFDFSAPDSTTPDSTTPSSTTPNSTTPSSTNLRNIKAEINQPPPARSKDTTLYNQAQRENLIPKSTFDSFESPHASFKPDVIEEKTLQPAYTSLSRRSFYPETTDDFSANTIQMPQESTNNQAFLSSNIQTNKLFEAKNNSMAKELRGKKASLLFLVPLASVCIALGLFCLSLFASNSFRDSFVTIFFSGLPQASLPGVRVDNPSMKKVLLDSGESVILISGKVFNGSDRLLKNTVLEVAGFNQQGQLLVKNRVSLGNSLNKTVVSSLTPSVIAQLQNQKSSRQNGSLSVGKDKEFLIALNDGKQATALDKLKSYTVRVSSVNY